MVTWLHISFSGPIFAVISLSVSQSILKQGPLITIKLHAWAASNG